MAKATPPAKDPSAMPVESPEPERPPKILLERAEYYKKYEASLKNFKKACKDLKDNNQKGSDGKYSKIFLEALKTMSESFHAMPPKDYPKEVSTFFRKETARILHEQGMVPVICAHVEELLPRELKDSKEKDVLDRCMRILMNHCYFSPAVARSVSASPRYLDVVARFIQEIENKPNKFRKSMLQYALRQVLNLSRVDSNREILRAKNFEFILSSYARSADPDLRLTALATLANIVDEEEKRSQVGYETTPDSIDFLMEKVKEACKSRTGTSVGWPFQLLLEVAGNMARSEQNGKWLVERGCLPYIAKLATSDNEEAETVALSTLWKLVSVKENVEHVMRLKEWNLLPIVKDKCEHHKNSDIRYLALGVLLFLKDHLQKSNEHPDIVKMIEKREHEATEKFRKQQELARKTREKAQAPASETSTEVQSVTQGVAGLEVSSPMQYPESARGKGSGEQGRIQVMMSYNREHREKVKEIVMLLLENGFQVWFDQTNMSGDTLDSMAHAVNTSDVICICFSRAYNGSANCKLEATYAQKKNKPIIPLKMENFTPEGGWLDIVLSTILYVDFSGKYPEDEMRAKLLRELEAKEKEAKEKGTVARKK